MTIQVGERVRVGVVPSAACPVCGLYASIFRVAAEGPSRLTVVGCSHADAAPERDIDGLYIVFRGDGE